MATISGPISRSGISALENFEVGEATDSERVVGNLSPYEQLDLTLFGFCVFV